MAFKSRKATPTLSSDPEQLYRDLVGDVDAPAALWVHQGDVLRTWHQSHASHSDVALELPTGAGKTLVGGLIGEWRRRTKSERVAYLCPTRQLAQQTAQKLESYGIPQVLLTGPVRNWDAADRSKYESGSATAVSVYSHLFNSNPALDTAQTLILDDVHAASSYVSGNWSLEIGRDDPGFDEILQIIRPALDESAYGQILAASSSNSVGADVWLAAPEIVRSVSHKLESALMSLSSQNDQIKWAMASLAGHIDRCMCYASRTTLLFRPIVPPTSSHSAFTSATQRIYMSATLGSGGELERSFGRPKIERISAPNGWDKKGTGRRFFCFPELAKDLSSNSDDVDSWISDLMKEQGRSIVLTPSDHAAQRFAQDRVPQDLTKLGPSDIEADLQPFTNSTEAVLILSNRYDGIDLPDEACRLVLLDGLPAQGDLQERFLHRSVGAIEVLGERFRSRVSQGAGRATRNSGDYAVVVVTGSDLIKFCLSNETRSALHPDIQAELQFGYEESLDTESDGILENIRLFLKQSTEWAGAETTIRGEAAQLVRTDPPGTAEIGKSAPFEVLAWQAYWENSLERALEQLKLAIDALAGGQAPRRYAALLNYLAACWTARLADEETDSDLRTSCTQYFQTAQSASRGASWIPSRGVPGSVGGGNPPTASMDILDLHAAEQVSKLSHELSGTRKFEAAWTAIDSGLASPKSGPFELSLVELGKFLGADKSYGEEGEDAAPDATWLFDSHVWICWEAKNEAGEDSKISPRIVRQANTHLQYVQNSTGTSIPGSSLVFLTTDQSERHPAASLVAEEHLRLVEVQQVRDLASATRALWTNLRAKFPRGCNKEQAFELLKASELLPNQWVPMLSTQQL